MTLRDEAADRLEPALELIRQAADAAGVPRDEVRVGGIPVVNAALNRESHASLVRLAGFSGLLGVLIAWLCFRDLRLTSLVLALGVVQCGSQPGRRAAVRRAAERHPDHDGPAGLCDRPSRGPSTCRIITSRRLEHGSLRGSAG